MKIAVAQVVFDAGIEVQLHSFADEVVNRRERFEGVIVRNKQGRTLFAARSFVDSSGDADLASWAAPRVLPPDDAIIRSRSR